MLQNMDWTPRQPAGLTTFDVALDIWYWRLRWASAGDAVAWVDNYFDALNALLEREVGVHLRIVYVNYRAAGGPLRPVLWWETHRSAIKRDITAIYNSDGGGMANGIGTVCHPERNLFTDYVPSGSAYVLWGTTPIEPWTLDDPLTVRSLYVAMHEFGHALGAWHSWDYGLDASDCTPTTHDCPPDHVTVMSYCSCDGESGVWNPTRGTDFLRFWDAPVVNHILDNVASCGKPLSGPWYPETNDSDHDYVADYMDNCPFIFNSLQADKNNNGIGNECDVVDPCTISGTCYYCTDKTIAFMAIPAIGLLLGKLFGV